MLALTLGGSVDFKKLNCSYMTLPGAPIMHSGVSYYLLNRAACIDSLATLSLLFGEFDAQRIFTGEENSLSDIYYSKEIDYRIYEDSELYGASDS